MERLRSDSPTARRIVFAFLDFLQSVEPGPGVDLEGLDVARECLEEVFELDKYPGEHIQQSQLLINMFSHDKQSKELNSNSESESGHLKTSNGPPTSSFPNNHVPGTSGASEFLKRSDDSIAEGVPKDELFGQFYAALDKINFFTTTPGEDEDHVQLTKATTFFEDAIHELEKSGSQIISRKNLAETFKSQGNKAMQSKSYDEAIELYTCAIVLCENAIYYCNSLGLSKWLLKLLGGEQKLWCAVFRDSYGTTIDWDSLATRVTRASQFFRALQCTVPILRSHVSPRLGDGNGFSFWKDNWSGLGPLQDLFPRTFAASIRRAAMLADCFHEDGWCPPVTDALKDSTFADLQSLLTLANSRLRLGEGTDGWQWVRGEFSVAVAYRAFSGLQDPSQTSLVSGLIWRSKVPLRVKFFVWLFWKQKLVTKAARARWDLGSDVTCSLCENAVEDTQHMFLSCPFAMSCWRLAGHWPGDLDALVRDGGGLWQLLLSSSSWAAQVGRVFSLLWCIWLERNSVVFKGQRPYVESVLALFRSCLSLWL